MNLTPNYKKRLKSLKILTTIDRYLFFLLLLKFMKVYQLVGYQIFLNTIIFSTFAKLLLGISNIFKKLLSRVLFEKSYILLGKAKMTKKIKIKIVEFVFNFKLLTPILIKSLIKMMICDSSEIFFDKNLSKNLLRYNKVKYII